MTAHFVPSPAPNISLAIHRATEPGSPEHRIGDVARTVVVRLSAREYETTAPLFSHIRAMLEIAP